MSLTEKEKAARLAIRREIREIRKELKNAQDDFNDKGYYELCLFLNSKIDYLQDKHDAIK